MQLSNSPALLLDFPKGVCCRWYPVPFSCCRRKCRAVFIYCSPKQVKLNQRTVEPQTRTSKRSSHIDLWWCTLFANIITFAFYGIHGFFLLLDLQNVTQVKSLQSGYIFLLIYLKIWLLRILIPYDWTRNQTLPSSFIQERIFHHSLITHSIIPTSFHSLFAIVNLCHKLSKVNQSRKCISKQ